MEVVDARGLGCPKPILLAQEALSKFEEGTVTVIVDSEASVENLKRFAERFGLYWEVERIGKDWKVKLVKGLCHPSLAERQKTSKELMIVVTSHIIGSDEALGRILMKAFFDTMVANKIMPDTVFLMNTAVRLSTVDDEFVEILRKMESMDVEIYTCGTCLKYFDLEDKLRVGFRGTTNTFVEGIFEHDKTLWIG